MKNVQDLFILADLFLCLTLVIFEPESDGKVF